jgi:hypothetical protein
MPRIDPTIPLSQRPQQPQQAQSRAAETSTDDVTEQERKARFRASLAWAVEEHAGLLERLAR